MINKWDLFGEVLNEVEASVKTIVQDHQKRLGIDPSGLDTEYEGRDDDLCDVEHMISGMITDILELQSDKTMGKLTPTDEGYIFTSKNGIEYDLYEGFTIGGSKRRTSDILFIVFDMYDSESSVVSFFYGAGFINHEDTIKDINRAVNSWEDQHPDIVKGIKDGTIEHV